MSSEIFYFTGLVKWAKVRQPDDKYQNYTIDLFMDEDSWDIFNESELTLEPKEVEEGEPNGRYVRFRRPETKAIKNKLVQFGPPDVLDQDNLPLPTNTMIGNGSKVTAKVLVYDSSKGKGHRLEAVRVDELVEYEGGVSVRNEVNDPF
jgi:hypothetical protein